MLNALLLAGMAVPALDTASLRQYSAGWEPLRPAWSALQGSWAASFGQFDGERWSVAKVASFRLTVIGNRYTVRCGDRVEEGLVRFTPGGVDLLPTSGPLAGRTIRGIYQMEEQRLIWCLARPEAVRPTVYAAAKGSQHITIIFYRSAE